MSKPVEPFINIRTYNCNLGRQLLPSLIIYVYKQTEKINKQKAALTKEREQTIVERTYI